MPTDFYTRVAKAAHEQPALRKHLVPLLRKYAGDKAASELPFKGKTIEGKYIRFHVFSSMVEVWDLTNAGKRGKTVDHFTLDDLDMVRDPDVLDNVGGYITHLEKMSYGQALAMAKQVATPLESTGMLPKVHEYAVKGIGVMPAGFQPLEIVGNGVIVEADYDTFSVRNTADTYNLPTCIPAIRGGKSSIPVFYRWVKDNQSQIKSMTYQDVMEQMRALKMDYHSYCAMD